MSSVTMKRRIISYLITKTLILLFAFSGYAAEINGAIVLRGDAIEGGLVMARTAAGNVVTLDDAVIPTTADGMFIIGFHRDSDQPVTIKIVQPDGTTKLTVLTPEQRDYHIQRIDGLQKNMVTPPDSVISRIKSDQEAVVAARQLMATTGDFLQGFDWPVTGRISGVFGSQRILNGKPRQPHYGIDIAAPKGTAVLAPASGRVTLVMDLYYSGWTILVAHGLGLNSSFLHLDQVAVSTGEQVKRGALLGWVGSSGRSTGPHLDWRLDWQGRRLDAALIAGPMPQ